MDPVKLVITNYEEGKTEELTSENGPDENLGTRSLPFSRELWIEQEDFMETPAKKWFRLAPGIWSWLKSAYVVKCTGFSKDDQGRITEITCEYFPESKSGGATAEFNVKGTIHWVSAPHAKTAEIRFVRSFV